MKRPCVNPNTPKRLRMGLARLCDRCKKRFFPTGHHTRLCPICQKKSMAVKMKQAMDSRKKNKKECEVEEKV